MNITNGYFMANNFSFKATVRYTCNNGYHFRTTPINTSNELVCNNCSDSSCLWSGVLPNCTGKRVAITLKSKGAFILKYFWMFAFYSAANSCFNVTQPLNGTVHKFEVKFGDSVRYNCFYGYKLVGQSTRRCDTNCNWNQCQLSGVKPTCYGTSTYILT